MNTTLTGAELIARERQRQIEAEGFDSRHDDDEDHENRELVDAAICYAAYPAEIYYRSTHRRQIKFFDPWPAEWDSDWDKRQKHPELKRLIIAGALIAAEIDRLLRQIDGYVEIKED